MKSNVWFVQVVHLKGKGGRKSEKRVGAGKTMGERCGETPEKKEKELSKNYAKIIQTDIPQ